MSRWPTVALAEVCDVRIGRTPRRDNAAFWTDGTHPWITVAELNGQPLLGSKETISDEALLCMPDPVPTGTVLFSFKLSIGKLAIAGTPLWTNEAIAALPITNPQKLDRDFLLWALKAAASAGDANHAVFGKVLNKSKVASLRIPLPPLVEQRRIVKILNHANRIRRLRREAIAKARELIPTLFIQMFGDPVTNPKESVVHPLVELAQVVSGVAKGRRFNGKATVSVPYIRVANVQAGRLDLSEIKNIEALPKEVEALRLLPNDVLLTEGGDHDKLGRGAMWESGPTDCIHQNHVFRVRCREHELNPNFYLAYLQTDTARSYFLRCAKRTTNLASINMTQLRALPVPVPPIALQRDFAERARDIQRLVSRHEQQAVEADALQASLLSQCFK